MYLSERLEWETKRKVGRNIIPPPDMEEGGSSYGVKMISSSGSKKTQSSSSKQQQLDPIRTSLGHISHTQLLH